MDAASGLFVSLLIACIFTAFAILRQARPSSISIHTFEDRADSHENYVTATRHLHYAGYKKYSKLGLPYRVRTSAGGERIILPLKYLQEVKNAPQSVASLPEEMSHLLLMNYTGVPQRTDAGTKVVRVDMTRQLGNLITAMDEECKRAFQRFMPACKDWTDVKIYPVLAQIVAQISGRVLVGQELCRDEDWLKISISFSTHAFGAARVLRAQNIYPWSLLWNSMFAEPVQRIRLERKRAAALLRPICEGRRQCMGSADFKPPKDATQWLLESHTNSGESIEEVVKSQLRLTMAAIHNTTMAVTNDLFDLIAHPEYVALLREEVVTVLAQEGEWTKQALTRMRKLDSFMKESARMSPTTMLTVKRKLMQDMHLHDGLVLPRGAHVAFASDGLNRDAGIYSAPDTFNGLRFYEQSSSDESTLEYVRATNTYLNWGGGKSACPGRFFASNEIKLIMAYLLQHFVFTWRDGESRPASAVNDWNILPDRDKVVVIRARE